jgi:CHAT domain-containing protein
VISPDDILGHLPFAALPYKGKTLANHFPISIVPSLETAFLARAKAAAGKTLALKPALAFGGARYQRIERLSPYISIEHERPKLELMDIKTIRQQIASDPKLLPMALANFAIGMPNLPYSEQDALDVVSAFGGEQMGSRTFIGDAATEDNWNYLVDSGEIGRYRVIHLSAHGFLSDDDPALSAVVLGQVRRAPGTDGYLTSTELSAAELNSDLFVISACNSGATGLLEGEGMRGLASSLFEAGTHHALLSLWPIGDKSSAEFMARFYDYYRAGDPPGTALAKTQRWAMDQGWPMYDWAAYVVYGV